MAELATADESDHWWSPITASIDPTTTAVAPPAVDDEPAGIGHVSASATATAYGYMGEDDEPTYVAGDVRHGGGWQDPEEEPAEPLDVQDSAERIRDLSFWYHAPDQNAGDNAADTLKNLSDDDKLAVIDDLSTDEVIELADAIPPERRLELEQLAKDCPDPAKRLKLWSKFHAGKAVADMAELDGDLGAGIDPDNPPPGTTDDQIAAARRFRAAQRTESEVDEEVQFLMDKAAAEGREVEMGEVEDLMKRKELEHEIERDYGVDMSNDGVDSIASYEDGDKNRSRKVWSIDELELMKPEFAKLSARQRGMVTEFRRGSQDHDDETGAARPGVLAHATPGGMIEVFGEDLVDRSDPANLKLKKAGAMVHEIGHQVDNKNKELSDRYKSAAAFKDFDGADGMAAHLTEKYGAAKAKELMDRLAKEPKVGAFKQQAVEIDGVVYQASTNADDEVTYDAYKADALPNRKYTENANGWDDEFDYARTNEADMFADHFKLAARDPVRLHSDMIDGPQREIDDLEAQVATQKAAGTVKPETQAQLDMARKRQETLQGQYDLMRKEVYGVTDDLVDEKALDVPVEQVDAFHAQAERCQTPDQLDKLAKLYASGKQVDASAIAGKSASLPPAERAAFEADAANCFTPDQLDKLAASYASGKRANGKWVRSKVTSDDESLLGY